MLVTLCLEMEKSILLSFSSQSASLAKTVSSGFSETLFSTNNVETDRGRHLRHPLASICMYMHMYNYTHIPHTRFLFRQMIICAIVSKILLMRIRSLNDKEENGSPSLSSKGSWNLPTTLKTLITISIILLQGLVFCFVFF